MLTVQKQAMQPGLKVRHVTQGPWAATPVTSYLKPLTPAEYLTVMVLPVSSM